MEPVALNELIVDVGLGPAIAYGRDQYGPQFSAFTRGAAPQLRAGIHVRVGAVSFGVGGRYRALAFWSRAPSEGNLRGGHPLTHEVDVLAEMRFVESGLGLGVGYVNAWLANPSSLYNRPSEMAASPSFRFGGLVLDVGYHLRIRATPLGATFGLSASFPNYITDQPLLLAHVTLRADIVVWRRPHDP